MGKNVIVRGSCLIGNQPST